MPHLADQTFALFAAHHVTGLVEAALPLARGSEFMSAVVTHLVPSRVVHYDSEFIYRPEDLVTILRRFAAATHWAWEVDQPRAVIANDSVRPRATVEFRWKGDVITWTFAQESDWVSSEFEEHILAFARSELPGEFIRLQLVDQTASYVYLEQAITETRRLLNTSDPEHDHGIRISDVVRDETRDVRAPLLLLLGAVGLLLLISCVNIATLLLGEAATRDTEMSARIALGATRGRIIRQLLTESVLLSSAVAPNRAFGPSPDRTRVTLETTTAASTR